MIKDYNGRRDIIKFHKKIRVLSSACVGGKKESEGPLGKYFDKTSNDPLWGEKSFEIAESTMCREVFEACLSKSCLSDKNIDLLLAGDLMNQCTAAGYGLSEFDIPYIGLYGACSTFAEGILVGSMMIESGHIHSVGVVASSHFCSAERQFRFPLSYGSFGSSTSQNTVTGAGAVILCDEEYFSLTPSSDSVYVTEGLFGIVSDRGIKDAANMGAAMCSAAADTLTRYSQSTENGFSEIDLIATGDLGWEGTKLLYSILGETGKTISEKLCDCGLLIYDIKSRDVGCGGSGCGCSAVVTAGYLLNRIRRKELKRVSVIGTGAMMSPKSLKQGLSIPAIAHLITLEGGRK